jgi:hypothetical protein
MEDDDRRTCAGLVVQRNYVLRACCSGWFGDVALLVAEDAQEDALHLGGCGSDISVRTFVARRLQYAVIAAFTADTKVSGVAIKGAVLALANHISICCAHLLLAVEMSFGGTIVATCTRRSWASGVFLLHFFLNLNIG